MEKEIVSHKAATLAIQEARRITANWLENKGFRYDEWENSVGQQQPFRQLRLRILRWENIPTQADLDEWFALIEPVLIPGYRRYTSFTSYGTGSWNQKAKGNAVQYYYEPDGKRWWENDRKLSAIKWYIVRRAHPSNYGGVYYVTSGIEDEAPVLSDKADTVMSKGYRYYGVAIRHQHQFENALAYT